MKKTRTISVQGDSLAQSSVYDPDFLRQQAHWIRDELDPRIARDGPDAVHSDDILRAGEFLRRLLVSNISAEDIRSSRIHLAVIEIASHGSRWPKRLADRCDALREAWESSYGPLKELGILLYEPGGRLHGICTPEDLSKENLTIKWLKSPTVKLSPLVARRFGSLGFIPGQWWINAVFAFRDGIIDSGEPDGGIVADAQGAYAVLMTDGDEVAGASPEVFTYRARSNDRGRYRLTAGTPESRHPVRILRSHSLRSFWTPRAGVRYDGLHRVTGWSLKPDPKAKETVYEITFKRLPSEPSMETVLCRPWREEAEDYKEYKRLRQLAREKPSKVKSENIPALITSGDGAIDVFENETAETPFQSSFTDKIPEASAVPSTVLTNAIPRHDSGAV